MTFSIAFLRDTEVDPESGELLYRGQITLNDFDDEFLAPGLHWSMGDYESQWRAGVRRLIAERVPSCLITAVGRPGETGVVWWILYPDGNLVHVQNHIVFAEDLDTPFDLEEPYARIPPREVLTDNGYPISEWHVSIEAFSDFLDSG